MLYEESNYSPPRKFLSNYFVLIILTITLLSNNFCNAQNQINASVSTVAADDKPITDFYGFNGQNIISGNVTLDDPDFLKKLCDLYPATLRFPGGTIAMYWDWKTGQFLENDISSNSCLWSKERYDNSNFTPNTLLRLKSFVDKTGAAPIFDLNTVTSDKYYQLAQLYEAASLNIPIKYVEFGNELYSEKLCAFPYVYPTPTDYANEMLLWNDVFKGNTGSNGHFPYLETAVVGSIHRTIYDPNKEPFREFNWNNEVLPIIGSGPSTIDAVTYHPYFGGGIGSDNNPKAIYNVQNPTRSFLIPNTALLGDVGSLLNEEAGSELNQYGLNGWLTEYNMFDDHNTILGSWAHAMAVSFHSLLFLEKSNSLNGAPNNIDHVNLHTMLGGSRWGAIFSNDNGLEFNEDEQFNGPITCNNNSNINLPSTEALEYTAVGQSMKLLTKASKNATRANRINFSNAPILSYSSWIPIDGVHGWLFEDSNQPTPVSQAILLNLTENPLTVNLNSTELSDMNTMESLSSEFYYYFTGENTSDCYNPIGYVYPTNTDCSCTYNKSTTAISNTITLAPFSINRLFKNDLNNCNNLIKLKANNDNICDGSSVGLQAYLLPLSDDVNNPTWTYNWSSSQSISLPSNTNSSSVVISPTHSGTGASTLVTYTVTISGTGCSTAPSATIDIFVHEKPTLNLTSSASPGNFSCQGEAITLEAEVLGSDQANFVWITDKAYGISAETITDKSSITVSPEETTEYIVYAVNNNRVCYLSNSITIPVLKLEEEVTICRGTDRLIDISNFINDANINLNNYDINWYIDNALQIGFTDQTSFLFTAPLNTSTINSIQVIIDNTTNPDCIVGETQITTVDCCRIPDLNAPDKNEITDGSTLTEFIEHYNSNMPANAIDLNNNTISIIGTGGGNQNDLATIYVFGKFFIDRNVDFKAVNFNMAEGSEVIVLPGANLNATERSTGQTPTVFEACSNYMWKGIRLMQNSQLIFRENTTSLINDFDVEVKDAEYGIYIENSEAPNFKSTPVSLSKVGLINNLNSIFIEPKDENATFNSHVSLVLKGCEVDGAQLKQAYIGQNTTVGAKANAAIVAYDANLAINNTTAAENIFKNLSNGIIANKCNLYLENNKFENITTDVTYNNKFNGTAIYASDIDYNGIRPAGFYSIEQKGFGKFSGNFTFTDCDVSIVTERMNVNISETEHDNVEKGIIVRHCTNRDVLIEKNTINSAKEGIELWNNDFANSISVQENDINFGYFPFPVISGTEPPLVSGIQVYETLNYNEDAKIHANNIQFMGLSSSARRFGINMLGTHNYEVSENFVFMTNNLTDEVGIRVYGCYNTNVSCNDVFGASNYNTNMRNSAITAFGLGYPLTVSCNDVNNTYDGILFHGPSNSSSTFSSVAGNIFRNHFNALHLTSSAVIGKQERTGNLWFNDPLFVGGAQGKNAIYDNVNNAADFEFFVNPNSNVPGNPDPDPMFIEPSSWFFPDSDPNWECDAIQYCSQFGVASNNEGELDEDVLDESIVNYPYTPETIWMLQSELYARLSRDSILLNSDSIYQAFYNNMQNDNIALFETVNEELLLACDLDQNVYNNLLQNNNSISLLMEDLSVKMEQMNDASLSNEALATLQAEISSLQNSIQSLVNYNNTAIELAQNTQIVSVANVEAVNTGIVSSETIEINEQEVNEIYLSTLAEDIFEFTTAQENSLFNIANQCPMSGGPAVFKARSLYAQVNPQQSYDDELLCLQQGILLRENKEEIAAAFRVYPNPTNNVVNIEYAIDRESKANIAIYNATGSLAMQEELDANTNKHQLLLKVLNNGVYYYTINVDGKNNSNGKIVIMK